MAKLTRREFAELCGVTPVYITQYVRRGAIIEEHFEGYKKKMIDTENPYNRDFKAARVGGELQTKKKKPAKVKKAKPVSVKPEKEPSNSEDVSGYDLDVIKKQRDIEQKEVRIRLDLLKEQKMIGDLIPKDLVQRMITQLSQSFLQTYTDKSEVFVVNTTHKNKLSTDAAAEMKGELIQMINMAHDKSITEAKKEFKSIIDEVKNSEL